jgi:ribonuclease HI
MAGALGAMAATSENGFTSIRVHTDSPDVLLSIVNILKRKGNFRVCMARDTDDGETPMLAWKIVQMRAQLELQAQTAAFDS